MRELCLQDVSVRFGSLRALAEVDLQVEAGHVVMLAGPNGSGKTTLLRVLLGLVRPNHGRLLVDGREHAVDNAFKAHLGYLPEAVAFSENLTGKQVLQFFASARGVKSQRVTDVLQQVGLSRAAGRHVRGYSRGMRQRLGLGISILSEPTLLVLDEPTGGLDQEGLNALWLVLEQWKEAGRMVLVATHDLSLMEHRVDRMCLLRGGTVRADDAPARLREKAALPAKVTFSLSGDADRTRLFMGELSRLGVDSQLALEGNVLTLDVRPERLLAVLDASRRTSGAVENLRVVEPGLDVVYEHMLNTDS